MTRSSARLSIVIPAYNEAKRLGATLDAVLAFLDTQGPSVELVLVDDGSIDDTRVIMEAAAARDPRVVPIFLDKNMGKGAAVRSGIKRARGHMVVYFDADLPYSLHYVPIAIERIEAGADLVIGARDLAPSTGNQRYGAVRKAASRVFNELAEGMLGLGIPDTQCGFKAFRGEVAKALFEVTTIDRFGFDVELLLVARHWRLSIERIPVEMNASESSNVRVFRDGLQMARDLWSLRARARKGRYGAPPPGLRR